MTTVSLIYPELAATGPYPAGVQWPGTDGCTRRAVYSTMIHQTMQIAVGWSLEAQTITVGGAEAWIPDPTATTPALIVNNDNYRFIGDGSLRVAPSSEALDGDGTVKPGYISEYMFFVDAFGKKTINVNFGIYYFIQDALVRKLNAEYPELELAMPSL